MIQQHPFLSIARIKPGRSEALSALLNKIGDDVIRSGVIPFKGLKTVHYMRWVILDAMKTELGEYPEQLALSTNYDGSLKEHLDELVQVAAAGLDKIYSCCEGYPEQETITPEERKQFLLQHQVHTTTFYVGTVGRSVGQIHQEDLLRQKMSTFLDQHDWKGKTPQEVYEAVKNFVWQDPELTWAQQPGPTGFSWDIRNLLQAAWFALQLLSPAILLLLLLGMLAHMTGLKKIIQAWIHASAGLASFLNILAVVLLAALGGFGLFSWWKAVLHKHESREKPRDHQVSRVKDRALNAREDILLQNQLTHLVEVKPSAFRHRVLRFVLWAVHHMGKFYWNKGKLGDIPTIHFARWVLIDNGKRLLFFSNFDGSWESYLGDFVDKASIGLTGVWSNTMDYPVTKDLLFSGSRNEEHFKRWARYHQVPTQVWYTAYPNISVRNIINNTKIRAGLYKKMNREDLEDWLRKF